MSYSRLVAKKGGSGVLSWLSFRILSIKLSYGSLWEEHPVSSWLQPRAQHFAQLYDQILGTFSFWSSQMKVCIPECWCSNFSVQSTELIVYRLLPWCRRPRTKQTSARKFRREMGFSVNWGKWKKWLSSPDWGFSRDTGDFQNYSCFVAKEWLGLAGWVWESGWELRPDRWRSQLPC